MGSSTVTLIAMSLPLFCFAADHPLRAARKPAILVRVFNDTRIDAETLRNAEREAAKIFDDAGIQSIIEAGGKDFPSRPARGGEFLVRIVDRKPLDANQQMLGFVGVERATHVRFAAAYRPAVDKTAKGFACETYQVLGAVMAHEIGHLILGPAHARHGIMHPKWGPLQFLLIRSRELEFTPEEAGRLRDDAGRLPLALPDCSDIP
jgi:hypothetical protein